MTDFRELCAELLCSLEQYPVQPPRDRDLIGRARAALAQPESIEDRIAKADAAIETSMERIRTIAATPARNLAQPAPQGPTDEEIDQLWDDVGEYFALYPEVRETIRAALTRWGCQ